MPPPTSSRWAIAVAIAVVPAVGLLGACGAGSADELVPPFRTALARLAETAARDDRVAVAGVDGWWFAAPELRHVGAGRFEDAEAGAAPGASRPAADPAPVLLDVGRQLDALGVELLLVPVPPKAIIFPEKVPTGIAIPIPVPRLDPDHQAFYDRLRGDGLEVLDLTRLFIRERFHPEGPLYCRTDTHWSGTGCTIAAAAIAEAVRQRAWFDDLEPEPFGVTWYSTRITGDLAGDPGGPVEREELRLRGVVRRTATGPAPPPPDPDSPIVLLGDSHALVFHAGDDLHARGAGLPDQLAFELGGPVDLVATRAPDAAAALRALQERARGRPGYWSGKRLVIWCFAATTLTDPDGWSTPGSLAP